MDSPRLSVDNNKKINILILIILGIVVLIIGLLFIYSYGMSIRNHLLNNIIKGLIYLFIILTFITSVLYISYRYEFGDDIIDNIDIIIKPIMYIALGGIVAMILLSTKNNISSSKSESEVAINIFMNINNNKSSAGTLFDTPNEAPPNYGK